MDELKFKLWLQNNSADNTSRTTIARCIRVEKELGVDLDKQFDIDQGKRIIQCLKYSRKDERENINPLCGISFAYGANVYAGMHSLRAAVKKYFDYRAYSKKELNNYSIKDEKNE